MIFNYPRLKKSKAFTLDPLYISKRSMILSCIWFKNNFNFCHFDEIYIKYFMCLILISKQMIQCHFIFDWYASKYCSTKEKTFLLACSCSITSCIQKNGIIKNFFCFIIFIFFHSSARWAYCFLCNVFSLNFPLFVIIIQKYISWFNDL